MFERGIVFGVGQAVCSGVFLMSDPIKDEWKDEKAGIRLILGDCLKVLPTLEVGSIDAVVTDPPYGIAYDASTSTQQGIQRFEQLKGDEVPFDASPWLQFDDVLAWCLPQHTINLPTGMGVWYAWDKVTQNGLKVRISEVEYAWHKRGTKTRMFRHLWSGAYRESESGQRSQHPTQKPIAVMKWCLQFVKAQTILDPFMGSGTTGVACIRTGRCFIGIETEPKYFEIAVQRHKRALREDRSSFQFRPKPRAKKTPDGFF